jgi:hypothetical protein
MVEVNSKKNSWKLKNLEKKCSISNGLCHIGISFWVFFLFHPQFIQHYLFDIGMRHIGRVITVCLFMITTARNANLKLTINHEFNSHYFYRYIEEILIIFLKIENTNYEISKSIAAI